jgi:hypothetical protein
MDKSMQDIPLDSFISGLKARIEAAEAEAISGSGQSDTLYEERAQVSYASILEDAPISAKARVEEILRERGFYPGFTPYEADDNECDLTGVDIDSCPCGRHP